MFNFISHAVNILSVVSFQGYPPPAPLESVMAPMLAVETCDGVVDPISSVQAAEEAGLHFIALRTVPGGDHPIMAGPLDAPANEDRMRALVGRKICIDLRDLV